MMDITRVVVVVLTHLIMLDLNSAESGEIDAAAPEASDETNTHNIPSRFTWAFSNATSTPASGSERPRNEVSADTDDDDVDDPQARVVYWIPTTCDSLFERGYTCVGCGESLHCMAGNFGLKAICYGRRPYCYNGVCSYIRGEKCQGQETHIADPDKQGGAHIADPVQPTNQDVLSANATVIADEIVDTVPINITGDIGN